MPLAAGARLGSYEILSAVGAGGMGEVYRARDTRLGRTVAIKILPDAVATDADRIARFQREAKALAALNHPHIATLFGVEESDGRHLLVMEFVDGESLADTLQRGPLPLDEALRIAREIADALEAAHERGIVHRDLKPANIMLTAAGAVKVLDFGLAKGVDVGDASASGQRAALTHSPTLSMMATEAGIILGTAAYMSPEQAKGLPADHRSDAFSFGVVLYEMLTGRQPFHGETAPDVLASVLARDPDLAALPRDLNPRLAELMKRCLEKNPKRRWQAIGDVRAELETIAANPRATSPSAPAATASTPSWKRALPIAVTAILFSGVGASVAWIVRRPSPSPVVRFSLQIPGDTLVGIPRRAIALSPDGTRLAYTTFRGLQLRNLNEMDARSLSPLNAASPAFSPDGQWIAFFANGDRTLRKTAVTGGSAFTICALERAPQGLTWSGEDLVFGVLDKGVMRVSANGGEPTLLAAVAAPATADTPQLIDGGRAVLFSLATEPGQDRWDKAQVVVQRVGSAERKVVFRGGSAARYVPTGHLLYVVGGTLLAIRFDVRALEVRGGPVPVIEGVLRSVGNATGDSNFAVSDSGDLAYVPGTGQGSPNQRLAFVDRTGKLEPIGLPPQAFAHPRISPDGTQVTYFASDGKDSTVWLYDLNGTGPPRRLTFAGQNISPIWTPDGRRITYESTRENGGGVFWQLAGGGPAEQLSKAEPGSDHRPEAWTSDGRTLFFRLGRGGQGDIWTLSLDGDRKPAPLIATPANEHYVALSPNGKWFAYSSSEGRNPFEIFVQPFPPTGAKYQITTTGARTPLWSPDGKQLYYVDGPTNHLVSVDIRTEPAFSVGKPTTIPLEGIQSVGPGRMFDITPDGKRFIVILADTTSGDPAGPGRQLNVVLNWTEELKTRLPEK